ncbi:hypothetical protein [Aurantimonas sp. VKM B-3413]|uniref:hypothetical protein n=1 Tax=Aurantimonas sp. VKM B-3413 TaxID=2779401 RepID=UPI001E3B9C13|nr:hypothetical protein [Aurantimonas sp. VKM B-3413]MCB8837525.1 hypothetical protein [Aurantimonas sp. VKM B-3413]
MHINRSIPAAATLLLLLGSTSAFAVDASAFADRLKAVAAKQNVKLSYDNATSEGDNVVLKNVAVNNDGEASKIGDITFEGVSGSTEEGWTVKRVPISDVDVTEKDTHTTITGISVEGVQLVGTNAADVPAAMKFSDFYFDKATVGELNVEEKGKQIFNLSDVSIANTIGGDGTFSSDVDLGTFTANFANGDPEAAKTMHDIGYDTLTGTVGGSASWDPQKGVLNLDPFEIDVENAGNLSFSYGMSGYTPAFIESMKQMQAQMSSGPEGKQAAGMAMMGLMSQLSLNSADLAYTDDSLADKLLTYYAQQNGQTKEQLVDQLTGMMPVFLGYLQNPDFEKQVSDAVTTFLKDPQSLSISIEPGQPVPAMQIMGAAMGAPQTLPQVLSMSVSANSADDEGEDGDEGDTAN